MASSDEAADDSLQCKRGEKEYMLETKQIFLLFARDNLPDDVYRKFVKTMTQIWKQRVDPDGETSSISAEHRIEMAMKLLQGWAPVKQSFLNFIQGRSPFESDDNADADVDANALIQSPLDFLRRAKASPDISEDDYAAMLQALRKFSKRTMTAQQVFHIVKRCMSNCPEMLEEFTNNYLYPELKAPLTNKKYCRKLRTGRVAKTTLCFAPDANQSLNGTHIKATNMRKEGSEESLLPEEDEVDNVKPLPDWITSRLGENLPPEVNPVAENFKGCTPSYYLLPRNCKTLQSTYRTKLGRSILNDALVCPVSGERLRKTQSDYERKAENFEDQMFESDLLLQRFKATAEFIANLQDRGGSGLRINEHITPVHRRCLQKLYNDDPKLDDLLERNQNTSETLSILLSRLNQRVQNLSEACLSLRKILPPLIAENYYRLLDHRGPSFKKLDTKRMSNKALLAEAKEIHKSRLNSGDEYADHDIHKDISRIISSMCSSEEKLMMTWTEVVHPFLSANCLRSYSEETAAPSEACENCGIAALDTSDALDTSIPGSCAQGNEPENKNEPRELSKRTTKSRSVRGGTCCSLAVLCRLYQILYSRLQTARDLCTDDLYTKFKEQLRRLLGRSIDNSKFEDFCLEFLGPNSFELFTLDIVINRVVKQLGVISKRESHVQFLEELLRTSNLPKNQSSGWLVREEGILPLHFERRKKRKLEDGASSSSQLHGGSDSSS
uniref:Uncharacterized protein n=1 Tax=Avena sativa TaxID=4498 RepID=A0ACD5T6P4_AVESA